MCAGVTMEKPPQAISGVVGLRLLSLENICAGVYFMCKADEIVYVGQSMRGIGRIAEHVLEKRKRFDRIYFIPCSPEKLNECERGWIQALKPYYNVAYNNEGKNKSACAL